MEWCKYGPFTVFDLETTGMNPVRDRIVEIAAARIDCDGTVCRFESLVNPRCSIPYSAIAVHHITDQMVADAPPFHEIGLKFIDFASGSTLVAHNARFDLSFLQESLARSGHELWKGKTLDTLALMRKIYRGLPSYSLQNLRRQFNLQDTLEGMAAHRAGADVEWAMQILEIAFNAMIKMANKT
ncbi:MAG: 3'-5' exonuclease [Victivallaceae bacterium]|jgi:DNA polymerase III epsilon subunit family exonuclease|nr:3'-5' exonuclease [Victivallaceae bacterium]